MGPAAPGARPGWLLQRRVNTLNGHPRLTPSWLLLASGLTQDRHGDSWLRGLSGISETRRAPGQERATRARLATKSRAWPRVSHSLSIRRLRPPLFDRPGSQIVEELRSFSSNLLPGTGSASPLLSTAGELEL